MKHFNILLVLVAISTSIIAQPYIDRQKCLSGPNQTSISIPLKKTTELKTKSLVQIYDSIYRWHWDTLSNVWSINPYNKTTNIIYDANNNQISESWQSWNGSAWENYFRYTNTYDIYDNMTSSLWQSWYGSTWDNGAINTYTYNASNILTGYLYQTWSSTVWVNNYQVAYTYDIDNNLSRELWQTWNGAAWDNSSLDTIYIYDTNNNLISYLQQNWNGATWDNYSLYTFTYDLNNNMTSQLNQDWNGAAWDNYYLYTYTYDVNNNMVNYLKQNWDSTTWDNSWQHSYTYDANNSKKSDAFKRWNSSVTDIESGDSAFYYFHTAVGINEFMVQHESTSIFPNPSSDKITVIVPDKSILEILNINGQIIKTIIKDSGEISIDLVDLSSGVYILRAKTDKVIVIRKFIKE